MLFDGNSIFGKVYAKESKVSGMGHLSRFFIPIEAGRVKVYEKGADGRRLCRSSRLSQ